MAVGFFTFDVWLSHSLKGVTAKDIEYFEFRIFKNEEYLSEDNEDMPDNLWDVQLVGINSTAKRPVFTTENNFCTFEADPDWDDPVEIVSDCVLKYLSDGTCADVLLGTPEGIYVSMPELSDRREKI